MLVVTDLRCTTKGLNETFDAGDTEQFQFKVRNDGNYAVEDVTAVVELVDKTKLYNPRNSDNPGTGAWVTPNDRYFGHLASGATSKWREFSVETTKNAVAGPYDVGIEFTYKEVVPHTDSKHPDVTMFTIGKDTTIKYDPNSE